jgi:hypothetical protein
MFKRRTLALLVIPLSVAAVIAILLAVRPFEDADPSAAVQSGRDAPGQDATGRDGGSAIVQRASPSALLRQLDDLARVLQGLEALDVPAHVTDLQQLTEEIASTTALISDAEPGSLEDQFATGYFRVTVASLELLGRIDIDPDARGALLSARNIAQLGRDTIARYIVDTQIDVARLADVGGT